MNDLKYRWILNVIIVVILATIGIQAYWNYKNYLTNKQQLINEVQISLDNAVDDYYAKLAENTTYKFSFNEGEINENMIVNGDTIYDRLFQDININEKDTILDSLTINEIEHVAIFQTAEKDTLITTDDNGIITTEEWVGDRKILKAIKTTELDSLNKKDFELLTAKVMLRLSNDTINIKRINVLLEDELKRKYIVVDYNLVIVERFKEIKETNPKINRDSELTVESKSSFLPHDSKLKMHFTNVTRTILKRIFVGILISTLLVLAVIACLFYLLKIIKHQKQLSEVKNDLISNITHEFKTPIATISVALESIKDFNEVEHSERTNRYLDMSTNQLSKLNVMVEKLLETATLDSDSLVLNKEKVNTSELLKTIVEKFQVSNSEKKLNFIATSKEVFLSVDLFHFENAINNIIDNAIKYGGDNILIELLPEKNNVVINVIDDGTSLENQYKEKLFEQFYRVPKGNVHDVKGFGIGLYYTKKIIEKHNGTIQLELQKKQTVFKITLPNG
jgi:two-component system phosphate regulon sensor histidine kinase PhoR